MNYRVYRLDSGGKIVMGEWIEASDDAQARNRAHEFCDETTPTVELWLGRRFVGALPCDGEAAA